MYEIQPNLVVLGEYKGTHHLITCKCLKHDYVWDSYPANLLNDTSHCPLCTKEKLHSVVYKNHDKFIERLKLIRNDVEIIGQYDGYHRPIQCKCIKHGDIFIATPRSLLRPSVVCPSCREEEKLMSRGEIKISHWLKNHQIDYYSQYKFKQCRYKLLLRFDFYLPELNICIEYDGEQHYKPIKFDGKTMSRAKREFDLCQIRDKIKNQFCLENNIKLIRIPYWEFDNIEQILNTKILN